GHGQFWLDWFLLVNRHDHARINSHGEVGPATDLISIVDQFISAFFAVIAKMRHELATGGKSEDADALRINVPFLGLKPDKAKRALCVFQWQHVLVITRALRHTVF